MIYKALILLIFPFISLFADGLEGIIKNHGTQGPVHGALVWLEGTEFIDSTDDYGQFSISNIPVGKYTVVIDHPDFLQKVYRDFLIDKTVDANSDFQSNPTIFKLEQNYPNPFNPSTKISFQIPNAQHVSLKIYNSLGKEITTIIDAWKDAGRYEIVWNANDYKNNKIPSGVYFYQITAGTFSVSKKMILMK